MQYSDQIRQIERAYKKVHSYKEIIPSEEFTTDAFQQWLEYATPMELACDIITKQTMFAMAKANSPGLA